MCATKYCTKTPIFGLNMIEYKKKTAYKKYFEFYLCDMCFDFLYENPEYYTEYAESL